MSHQKLKRERVPIEGGALSIWTPAQSIARVKMNYNSIVTVLYSNGRISSTYQETPDSQASFSQKQNAFLIKELCTHNHYYHHVIKSLQRD